MKKPNNPTWLLTRQFYSDFGGECDYAVEISEGLDAFSDGMYAIRFGDLGEGSIFTDPREAVKYAVKIKEAWTKLFLYKNGPEGTPDILITIVGATAGAMGLQPAAWDEDAATEWAEEKYAQLALCPHCQEPMPNDKWYYLPSEGEEELYCSQNCADLAMEQILHDNRNATCVLVDGPQSSQNAEGDEVGMYYVFLCDDDLEPIDDEERKYWDREFAIQIGTELANDLDIELVVEAGYL